jgi:TolB-like protein
LASLLCSRLPQKTGRARVQLEVRQLSAALAPAGKGLLTVTRDSLSLRPDAIWIDTQEVTRASAGRPEALSLLDRELLEDLDGFDPAFDAWLKQEREQLRFHARTVAAANLGEQNGPDAVILAARRLLFIDPVDEGGWRALMRAHAELGDQRMAVVAYEQCQAALAGGFNIEPSADTRELLDEILHPETVRPSLPTAKPPGDPEPPVSGLVAPIGPRVGVLPMRCIGLPEEARFLGSGLAREITAALSRFHRVTVTAADALARFARDNPDEALMRRAFGIDYLLDGTAQFGADRLRVSLRLLDLRDANKIVWAERFDRAGGDLNAAQSEIAAEAVARIEPELQMIEALRHKAPPHPDASANDLLLSTIPAITRMDREGFIRAGETLERAVALEPNFCDAHGWYAFWHVLLVSQGWAADPRQALIRGGELAERAMSLNPLAIRAITIAGLLRAHLEPDLSEAAAFYDRALEVNSNLAMTWALSAVNCANMGDIDEAERRYNTYKVLSPHDRLAFFFDALFAPIHLIKRDHQAAIETGSAVVQLNPAFSAGYKPHLAALGHLRCHQEAASVLRRLLAIEPNFTIRRFLDTTLMRRQADREHFAEGLRLAGVS